MGVVGTPRREDLTGKKFNKLTVVSFDKTNRNGAAYWFCVCECGKTISTRASSLKSGKKKSCGHEKHETKNSEIEYIDETGESYSNKETKRVYKNKRTGVYFTSSSYRVSQGSGTGYMRSDENRKGAKISPLLSTKANKNSLSGIKGVSKRGNRWIARIMVDRKSIYLGSFNTKQEAIEARLAAEEKYFKPILEKYEKENPDE